MADTGFSRFPVRAGRPGFSGYLHVKDILDLADDPDADGAVRAGPAAAAGAGRPPGSTSRSPCCAGPGRTSGARSTPGGATAGLVTLEDLIEHYVGTVRDATHAREERA